MSFHTLGLSVWPTCDKMLLMAGGRLEEAKDVIADPAALREEDVVTGETPSTDPLEPVTPIATDEYDGEPLTTLVVLLAVPCLDTSDDDDSGNNCRLAGVGGFTTPEPEELLTFAFPPEIFLAVVEETAAAMGWELVEVTWVAANGAFLLLLAAVCVVVAQRAVLGM